MTVLGLSNMRCSLGIEMCTDPSIIRKSYISKQATLLLVRPECQKTGEDFASPYFFLSFFKSSSLKISCNIFCSYLFPLPTPPRSTFSYTQNCVSLVLFCISSTKSSLCYLYML